MIEEEVQYEIVTTRVDTSESLELLPICLKFFFEFIQTSIGPSNVIPLEVFDVRPLRKTHISYFCIYKSFT